ncbi:PREDICTED: F-box/kelch-repeat protein At5g49000-like [Camelina sativa]|uniref:F-box/kelch-repeat protein At5g49000-like n=1 Tax=Camelina sativa TaxID=90675 RepID=A0ABM0US66_CAMSA|nr:PREDICTED: F-box/kelch-repeat protein At5g49000-like [Camelina sativa]
MGINPSVEQSMKGRISVIRELTPCHNKKTKNKTKKKKEVCGLWSLPDEVVVNCLAQLSRLDLAALAIASKSHRSLVVSSDVKDLRWQMGCVEQYLYVCLHIFPEPSPRWFIFHPMQRCLKPIHMDLYDQAPTSASAFVPMSYGIYIIGGLVDGKPTSEVSYFNCFKHKWYLLPPMKMARASPSASLMLTDSGGCKIYVFGGLGDDVADSSNWAEVYDISTQTWDFLFVFTPKMPLTIQQSVLMISKEEEEVYVVDEDGQNFSFSPSKCMFVAKGKTDSMPGYIY